jgi:hypothetical protein
MEKDYTYDLMGADLCLAWGLAFVDFIDRSKSDQMFIYCAVSREAASTHKGMPLLPAFDYLCRQLPAEI